MAEENRYKPIQNYSFPELGAFNLMFDNFKKEYYVYNNRIGQVKLSGKSIEEATKSFSNYIVPELVKKHNQLLSVKNKINEAINDITKINGLEKYAQKNTLQLNSERGN